MASISADQCWENVEIDGALLMALLEEPHEEGGQDERLGFVIQSLEAEIGNSTGQVDYSQFGNYEDCMDCGGLDAAQSMDGGDYSRLTCHIGDPFDWAEMNMAAAGPQCDDIGNWYVDTSTNEVGMVEFGDVRDYYYSYADNSIEYDYSPLWQET